LTVTDGNARTIIYTPEATTRNIGWSTAGVGDVNKDTFDDFVICDYKFDTAKTDVGACYVVYGGNNLQSMAMTNLGSGGFRITGTVASQSLGNVATGVGDINKDGYADILMSCLDRKNVYLLYGGPSLTNVDTTSASFPGVIFPNPTTTADKFGVSVSRAGDGYADLMIGSTSTTRTCQIYVVFGGSSLSASFNLNTMTSSTGVRYFTAKSANGGYSVSGGVDFNRDGYEDIIIGANVSQTTVNNVDLVSVTRTNRRLLLSSSSSSSSPSSVVHWMLASVSLFSYKVVAEIHFNLIDFPGLNESYVAGTKSKVLMQSMESHEFDRIISYYATINNATQLMSNATVSDVVVTTSVIPVPSSSSEDNSDLSTGQVVGLVVGVTMGVILFSGLVYLHLLKTRLPKRGPSSSGTPPSGVHTGDIVIDIARVHDQSDNFELANAPTEARI
jgi:hypothetical protein